MTEIEKPTTVRRDQAFSQAVFDKNGKSRRILNARLVNNSAQAMQAMEEGDCCNY